MSVWENENTREALKQLKNAKMFTKAELKEAEYWLQESPISFTITDNGIEVEKVVGLSPRKAGEVLGINGNSLQNRCRGNRLYCERTVNHEWVIPVREIIRLRKDQITKGKVRIGEQ